VNPNALPQSSSSLSGHYRLRVGVPDSIAGQRPVLAGDRLGRLLRGQGADAVERTLGNVFTLCAHAHRRTARLALNAASVDSIASPVESSVFLRLETARDHLRSMALDWPQRQVDSNPNDANLEWLKDCPLSLVAVPATMPESDAWTNLAQLRDWLSERVLGLAVREWLERHRDPDTLARWCHTQALPLAPARCLHAWHAKAHTLKPRLRRLDVLDVDAVLQSRHLRQLGQAMATESGFVQHPGWLGQCAETGPWARLRHRRDGTEIDASAWTRLSARWLELMELAAADTPSGVDQTDALLSSGALALGEGQAIAWCEMARGLLLHWVQLDPRGAVQDYRVLAPTEWNFHPEGALAQALSQLHPSDSASASVLAAAYDPCVECSVLTSTLEETQNA